MSNPGFYRSSAELDSAQVMSQGSLCGTVTQTGSSGSSKPFSGTSAQRGFACTRGFPELCGFHPDPRVPLPRSLPALELEAEPGSLRVGGRGSKNWGRGKRELGVGGGLGGLSGQALVSSRWAGDTRRHTEGRARDWHLSLSGMLRLLLGPQLSRLRKRETSFLNASLFHQRLWPRGAICWP